MAIAPMNARTLTEAVSKLESIGYKRCEQTHVTTGMCFKKVVDGRELHVTIVQGQKRRIYISEVEG